MEPPVYVHTYTYKYLGWDRGTRYGAVTEAVTVEGKDGGFSSWRDQPPAAWRLLLGRFDCRERTGKGQVRALRRVRRGKPASLMKATRKRSQIRFAHA